MRRVAGAVPLAVSLLIATGAVALLAYSSTLNPIDAILGRGAVVTVPDFAGTAQPRAVAEAEDAGLDPSVEHAFSLTAPRGTVVSQDPEAGTDVREGDRVVLTVSDGARRVDMPDAVGRPLSEIVPPLEEAGVPIETTDVASEQVAEGVIISQVPAPGVEVTGEDTVRFEVSSGPDARPVPEIVGLTADAAAFELGVAGLTIGELTPTSDASVPIGAVVSIDPPAGSVVGRETPVDLVVSFGPPLAKVPDVVRRTAEQAVDALEALGYRVVRAGRLVASDQPGSGFGAVFEQYPAAGTDLQPGQPVTIVVGRLAPDPPPLQTTTTAPRPTTTTTAPDEDD